MRNKINNVIIFDGETEFSSDEIYKTKTLLNLVNTSLIQSNNICLIDEINEQNGILHLKTDKNYKSVKIMGLINVSKELEFKFFKER